MRNPMITGVVIVLIGEAFLYQSEQVLFWAGIFLIINHLYFIFKEEPDLSKRFGEEYITYKRAVPRWLPRFKPYKPELEKA
jgi:protein-S-isoprenylcysteine O-methyltransferase Ste14